MRAAKAMKAMKRVSKFAKGKLAKLVVFRGNKAATLSSGLTKSSLMRNKHGRIVSKKQSANGKKAYARIKGWTLAFMYRGVPFFTATNPFTPSSFRTFVTARVQPLIRA